MDQSLIPFGVVNCATAQTALAGADRISYACTSSSTVRFAATVLHLIVLGTAVAAAVLLSEIMLRVVQQWRAASLAAAGIATAERAGTAAPARAAASAGDVCLIAAGALSVGCARDDCARLLSSAREAAWFATRSAEAKGMAKAKAEVEAIAGGGGGRLGRVREDDDAPTLATR